MGLIQVGVTVRPMMTDDQLLPLASRIQAKL